MSTRQKWEERWHPLRREWVIVAAHRQDRPWSGKTHKQDEAGEPEYDPDCYFCPGNRRVSGERNPDYDGVYVFNNDHPCVSHQSPADLEPASKPYLNRRADGTARVVCYHPRHDLSLSQLSLEEVVDLIRCWQEQYQDLGRHEGIEHVLIFENRGDVVGVSNPHPHCQIYGTNFVFKTIENETRYCREHFHQTGRSLLEDMVDVEVAEGRRLVVDAPTALSFVPYCARWAYETYVVPKRRVASVDQMTAEETASFAAVLLETVIRYDNLWKMSFPYVMVLHNAPTDGASHDGFHFHIEFHPPMRKPHLVKHLAGPEIGGGSFLSDTWPEDKAEELRSVSPTHYTAQSR